MVGEFMAVHFECGASFKVVIILLASLLCICADISFMTMYHCFSIMNIAELIISLANKMKI